MIKKITLVYSKQSILSNHLNLVWTNQSTGVADNPEGKAKITANYRVYGT